MEEQIEVLQTAKKYLKKLLNGVALASEFFQSGHARRGFELVAQIAEGLQWLTEALRLTQDVQQNKIETSAMDEKLREIIEAIVNEDSVLLSDLLEYELQPILKEWDSSLIGSITA